MQALTRIPTTEMEVTSIRLERELKERLKTLSGSQGYQALIRDILWNYVQQRSNDLFTNVSSSDIRATFTATAEREERCSISGRIIRSGEEILLGLTTEGNLVPIHPDSLS
ncbi:MAG: hypothetical protein B0A82_21460 [Alkalinema sp. CACIAM 70d]|uniref:hypothetical protein n=1 Tax=Alkalinema sp. FACHB-956 TaxID=2692768 RepID=UPI000B693400|nr:hypothetical protein [Alkalinema sp. FACHB-956]MBD2328214.1 hypothetical protein [Alkalinema sp. FACHB-956]OUC12645.1 MAG: hypothetical protein B0A82_21460 [Alkalinema sp. CACIAM 70d]